MTPECAHQVDRVRFRDGTVECSCGAVVTQPGTPEALAEAWLTHRRDVGLRVNVRARDLASEHTGSPQPKVWGRS